METRTSLRGRKRSLSADDISRIDQLIQQQPDLTVHEVTDTLQLHAGDETVRKTIVKLGYVYKRSPFMLQNKSVPDVKCFSMMVKFLLTTTQQKEHSVASVCTNMHGS